MQQQQMQQAVDLNMQNARINMMAATGQLNPSQLQFPQFSSQEVQLGYSQALDQGMLAQGTAPPYGYQPHMMQPMYMQPATMWNAPPGLPKF